jgi:hypothetical protein
MTRRAFTRHGRICAHAQRATAAIRRRRRDVIDLTQDSDNTVIDLTVDDSDE